MSTTNEPQGWRVLGFGKHPENAAAIQERLRAGGLRARNFALTDEKVDAHFLEQQRKVIIEEDGWMLSAIQQRMDEPGFADEPVLFNVDTGAVRVRRVMERLIAAEAG